MKNAIIKPVRGTECVCLGVFGWVGIGDKIGVGFSEHEGFLDIPTR